jgi:hypothetical protein
LITSHSSRSFPLLLSFIVWPVPDLLSQLKIQ